MSTATLVRKKNTGEAGNGGEFGHKAQSTDEISLPQPATPAAETVFTKRYDTPQDKVKAFMEELDKKVDALQNDEDWQEYLKFISQFHHYSFNNQLLILLQRPNATRVAGYRKWEEMGRQVRKGEKGIGILAPRKAKVEVKDGAGRPILDAKGKPRTEYKFIGVTTATVFDISQTDGPPIPENRQDVSELPPEGLIDDLKQAIADQGFTVGFEDMSGGRLGYTTTDGSKRVAIKNGLTDGEVARVLAHELGHIAAGHTERPDEYHLGHDGQRRQMEVEADSISYTLLRVNGMSAEVGGANARYIDGWQGKDKNQVKEAAGNVTKAVKDLLDKSKWRNAL